MAVYLRSGMTDSAEKASDQQTIPADARSPGGRAGEAEPFVRGYALGPWQTNSYVIGDEGTKECWIVDPSFGPSPVLRLVAERGLTPRAIVLTHTHVDHIGGIAEVLKQHPGLPIWVHRAEAGWLGNPLLNLSDGAGMRVTAPDASRLLNDGDELRLGGQTWRVLHTPGHSPGGVTLHHEPSGTALVGDTLFAGSIGRTDLPGGDYETLERSIRTRLYSLPDRTRCLPGHGPATTIGDEKRYNPFVPG